MTEFWLISAPGEKNCQQTWDKMNTATAQTNLSTNHKFNIPELKVGTLDILVGLSDELAKLDSFVESVVRKVAQYMADVLEDSRDKVQENLLANGVDLVTYVTRFHWDMAKYPIKQSLKNISEILSKQVSQIDNDLKARASAYNSLKGNLQSLERKNVGSLLTRSLADIVKKEDFVLDSEYLITLLVVVPKTSYPDWHKTYETLSEMVVPRSTKLLVEDQDSGLFSVTLFRKAIDDFKHKARENKFMVRDFQYNEEEMKADKEEMTRLSTDKKKQFVRVQLSKFDSIWNIIKSSTMLLMSNLKMYQPHSQLERPWALISLHFNIRKRKKISNDNNGQSASALQGPLVRWLKVNFSEAFIAWVHIKALRVFTESVLRYGLPVNFQAMLLQPNRKNMKKLREVLQDLYKHLDSSSTVIDASMDIPGLNLSQQEYYPYVYYKIDCSLLEFK
ncbi:V-type proton ATPase subunit C 1-B isoform X1 [Carassius carassius]|uniref:V-type proton ATPase subunit C 1-B isoform X1 n=1 Tax=Carassius carassius TaxID=217509 RepID=UPI002868A0A0|nr:V-type proton ATPase subunit C 1-B isoform X1 [Carassius carassius]